jgi:O-antigen ligase
MRAFGPSATFPLLLAALGASLAAAYALVQVGPKAAIALGALPLAALAAGALLTTWGRVALLMSALALPLTGIAALTRPLPLAGPAIFLQDVLVVVALAAWAVAALVGRGREAQPPVPRTPVLGWAFALFAAAIVIATMRGHYAYGASLFGQPLRLVLYAAIVVTLAGLTVERLYRLLLGVFYAGTLITTLFALYYIATGTSQTDQFELSTGGARILGISTSLYCAGALFLALLSLRVASPGRARVLHLVVAALALFCIVLGFGRAVYAAVAVVCLLLVVGSRSIRHSILWLVPLAVPFLILLALLVNWAAPELVESVSGRVSSPPATDANVQWRVEASRAVLEQIREQPLVGVGFGRESDFFIEVESESVPGLMVPVRQEGSQDPHNGYLYLWAGGGLAALAAFAFLLAVFAIDAIRRFRASTDPVAQLIVVWAAATLFAFLFNSASGTSFESPMDLLTMWALLVLPAVVQHRNGARSRDVEHVLQRAPR